MKTRTEVITRALRRLRIVSHDETATADQEATCSDALDGLADELQATHGITIPSVDSVDEHYFLPLAYLLAAEVAPSFSVASPETRGRALIRLGSALNPDDRRAPNPVVYY